MNQDGRVTLDEFKSSLDRIREKMNKKAGNAKEYTSHLKMKEHRFKHKRLDHDLTDKFKTPMTFNQSVGFQCQDKQQLEVTKQDMHPIRKCDETKYADEMIRTGFI